ncbi:unnamed protein product [Protopolystoma xenopodis]|uniref:Ig-like domain-containing protein n=1 Tax=Protopolystoma xenopodis TaxID=117903 RepID=A0A448WNW4_9PLAT|nr:unnamed protein product [Protopolystoma xenopodis]
MFCSGTLLITSLNESDSGSYECMATNEYGKVLSNPADLHVRVFYRASLHRCRPEVAELTQFIFVTMGNRRHPENGGSRLDETVGPNFNFHRDSAPNKVQRRLDFCLNRHLEGLRPTSREADALTASLHATRSFPFTSACEEFLVSLAMHFSIKPHSSKTLGGGEAAVKRGRNGSTDFR